MHGSPGIPVFTDAPFSQEFLSKQQSIKPIIFSHGYTGHGNAWSGMLRDWVSHGYIVFSMDHQDGSSSYTEKEDGTAITLDTSHLFGTLPWIEDKIDKRVSEVSALIDEISETDFL